MNSDDSALAKLDGDMYPRPNGFPSAARPPSIFCNDQFAEREGRQAC
jgi:hypothetical protein